MAWACAMRRRTSLMKEIILALILKGILLYGLWQLCFAHPLDQTLQTSDIYSHLAG